MKNFTHSDVSKGEKISTVYADHNDMVDSPLWWHKAGLQQTATGYGRKLTTRYKVQFEGKLYRVYATCYSNVASHWFTVKGEKIFIN